jgi:plastocyanin
MRRFRILALLSLATAGLALVGCGAATPPAATPATTAPDASAPAAETVPTVSISNFSFSPTSLDVKVGDTVTWVNNDDALHTVTGDGGISSPNLAKGESYKQVFDTAGTFSYSCSIHPAMKGTITVK